MRRGFELEEWYDKDDGEVRFQNKYAFVEELFEGRLLNMMKDKRQVN